MNVRKPVDYGTMYRELTAILTQAHGLEALDDMAVVDDRPERHGGCAGLRGLLRQAHGPLHAEAEARRLS